MSWRTGPATVLWTPRATVDGCRLQFLEVGDVHLQLRAGTLSLPRACTAAMVDARPVAHTGRKTDWKVVLTVRDPDVVGGQARVRGTRIPGSVAGVQHQVPERETADADTSVPRSITGGGRRPGRRGLCTKDAALLADRRRHYILRTLRPQRRLTLVRPPNLMTLSGGGSPDAPPRTDPRHRHSPETVTLWSPLGVVTEAGAATCWARNSDRRSSARRRGLRQATTLSWPEPRTNRQAVSARSEMRWACVKSNWVGRPNRLMSGVGALRSASSKVPVMT